MLRILVLSILLVCSACTDRGTTEQQSRPAEQPAVESAGEAPAATGPPNQQMVECLNRFREKKYEEAIEAFESFKGDTFVGPTTVNPKTHQIDRPYFILKTKKKSEMKGEYDLATVVEQTTVKQPAELNECKDIGGF